MLQIAVKFCGGCNPHYDRSVAYETIKKELADIASFSLPMPGQSYDALLILRGCTGCPYLYDEITAKERILCMQKDDISEVITKIRNDIA